MLENDIPAESSVAFQSFYAGREASVEYGTWSSPSDTYSSEDVCRQSVSQ